MPARKRVAIVPDLSERFDREVVRGISRFVHERGQWSLYLHDDPHLQLPEWRGHGVIANMDDPKVAGAVRRLDVPIVDFGGGRRDSAVPSLVADDAAIGRLAAEHLLERGFTRFAFCGWPPTRYVPWSSARGEAFAQTVGELGYPCAVYQAQRAAPRKWDALLQHLSRWIAELGKPLGLMAANDARARQVLEACRQVRVHVPEEVAVIGVDNDDLTCELAMPPLSSVIQGAERLGYESAKVLERLMSGRRSKEGHVLIPPIGIVTRQSTDVLAIADPEVAAAVRFIRDRANERIQVADVVVQSGVSRTTLEGRFRQTLDRTIHEEILRVRIQGVQQLLRQTDMSLEQIASRTGFAYVQYLANVFRRECGQTAGQYRNSLRRGGA